MLSLFKKDEYDKIVEKTSELLKFFPNSNKILLLRAMSSQSLSKDEQALKDYRNVLFRDANNFFALKILAQDLIGSPGLSGILIFFPPTRFAKRLTV